MSALPLHAAARALARAAMRPRAVEAPARHVELGRSPATTRRPAVRYASPRHRRARTIRYAVIGLGPIAQVAVLPAFARTKNSTLAALVSRDRAKLAQLGKTYDVAATYAYDDLDQCLRSPGIDAVYVALPPDLHYECGLRAAAAGKHILCEEPLAITVPDAEEMLAAAERHGVKLMTAHRVHFAPASLAAIAAVRAGKIGEVRYFSSKFSYRVADPHDLRRRTRGGGGPLHDLGVSCIDAARRFMGDEPEEVMAFTADRGDRRVKDVEESVAALLRFPRGRLASFVVSLGAAERVRYEIVGTKGSIALDPACACLLAPEATVKQLGERERGKKSPHTDRFAAEIEAFSRAILRDREPEPHPREGIADLRIVAALLDSAASGRAVRLAPLIQRRRPGPPPHPTREPRTVHVTSPHA